ncbi:MAG: hypothetical protein M1827_006454 [Pycnora praestabilis]|nr:MAG: hypothetical protein M1827_006454 [Pycnora praestabilis]
MPPRKSDASKVATVDEGTPGKEREGVNVEDLSLPKTMVQRLAKGVLPPNTQIQKDAILAISKSATVFVNYLSSHANESAMRANKKTIMPKDVLEAISELEFEGFLPRLEAELSKYNEVQTDKRNSYRKKVKEDKIVTNGTPSSTLKMNGNDDLSHLEEERDSSPAAKKVRRSTLNGAKAANGHAGNASNEDTANRSGDDTVSEAEEVEQEVDEVEEDDEDIADDGRAEDVLDDDPQETQEEEVVEDEALDNGEDSD